MKYLNLDSLMLYHDIVTNKLNKEFPNLTNCPNCGAPITKDRCEYCGTHFNITNSDYSFVSIPIRY